MDNRLKKITFRAAHRGMKEMDLLLGVFAERHLCSMSSEELDLFETLLSLPDPDLYAWITGMEEVPDRYRSVIMQRLQAFNLQTPDYSQHT